MHNEWLRWFKWFMLMTALCVFAVKAHTAPTKTPTPVPTYTATATPTPAYKIINFKCPAKYYNYNVKGTNIPTAVAEVFKGGYVVKIINDTAYVMAIINATENTDKFFNLKIIDPITAAELTGLATEVARINEVLKYNNKQIDDGYRGFQ